MEHYDPSTSTIDAPPPPLLSSSNENVHQMAEQADREDLRGEEAIIPRDPDLNLSTATSTISTPATSPRLLMDMHDDILESIFLRVPAHNFKQIRSTCREFLNNRISMSRYIEHVVQRGETLIPVRLRWESRVACYKNRYSKGVSWRLGCNLGSCYYRCYNIREISSIEDEAENPTPIPCHGRLFCPWIECTRLHRWFDGGFVITFLRNKAPEFENSSDRRPSGHQLCSVCSNKRPASYRSCMASLLYIKNPLTSTYKRLPIVSGRWTSKLKCIATNGGGNDFKVLIAILAETPDGTHETSEQISFEKIMIYDSVKNSWREIKKYFHHPLGNIKVVDTHGVYCRGAMYWLLEGAQSLIIFQVEKERWEILTEERLPQLLHPLGLVVCMEEVFMAEAHNSMLIIWKLIERNSLDQSPNKQGFWQEVSRSPAEYFWELRDTEMALHSACSPSGDGIICFENLVNRTAVTYNVGTERWGRSNDVHGV